MAGVRVSQIPDELTADDIRIYFSNSRNGGGKICNIYFALLNNDAVLFFRNPEVVDLLLSRDHNLDGNEVNIVRTDAMIFSEVSAKLNPEISSLISVSDKIKNKLQYVYVIEVDVTESEEDHCISLVGNIYQIELAWNAINQSLKTQHKIHSRFYQNQESKDGDRARERTKQKKNGDNDTPSFSVKHDTLTQKLRDKTSDKAAKTLSEETALLEISTDPYTSHGYHRQTTARFVEESAAKGNKTFQRPKSSLMEGENVPNLFSSQYNNRLDRSGVRAEDRSMKNQSDINITGPALSTFDQLDLNASGSFSANQSKKLLHNHQANSNTDYKNVNSLDRIAAHGSQTYHVNDPKIHIQTIGDISDDTTDDDEVQKLFQSSHRSTDSERSRQAKDTFREFSNTSPQPKRFPEEKAVVNQTGFSTDFSLSSHHEFTIGNVKVVVSLENITAVTTDVLVNAANGSLFNGAEVAGAISKAADLRLEIECENYIRRHGMMSTAQVMHTSAGGRLKVKHILHAVGPIWLEHRPERCTNELIQTYLNCFEYADSKLKVATISVPYISSGIFGAPLDTSVQCFLDAVLLYYNKSRTNTKQYLKEIHMVNNDEDAVVTTIVIINSLLEEGLYKAVNTATEKFTRLEEKVGSSAAGQHHQTMDDWSPQSLPAQNTHLRRISSLDRNSTRAKNERHEFKTSTYNPNSINSSAVPKFSSKKLAETKTSSKSAFKSPVLKQTLTNPVSLRPKTAPSRSKTTSFKTKTDNNSFDLKFTRDSGIDTNDVFDGSASLPAHLVYQNHHNDCPICLKRMKNPKTLEKC